MKRFICTLLIFAMLPIACFAFTGCKNNKQDIKTFYTSYKNIVASNQYLTLEEANDTYQLNTDSYKIDIDYTKSSKLSTLVEDSSTKYYYLKYFYQKLLDDSLAPLYFFGEKISSSNKVSEKHTKQLFDNLLSLKQEYEDINYYLGTLVTSLSATDDETINLSYLKKLLSQYEQAITEAGKLSAVICEVYFGSMLSNSNFDYSSKTYEELSDADLSRISIDTRTRMYYYKAVYANIYNQLYVRNSELADRLVSSSATLPAYAPYTYFSNISSIENQAIENLRESKQDIYNNALSLYNIQNNFTLAYKHFNLATTKVAYLDLNERSTKDEINYGKIITQFVNGIAVDSYEILHNLVNLLYL